MSYKPVRDRGVYRAAANPKSPNHAWAKDLLNALKSSQPHQWLKWVYRQKGAVDIMADLIFSKNPLLAILPKEDGGFFVPLALTRD